MEFKIGDKVVVKGLPVWDAAKDVRSCLWYSAGDLKEGTIIDILSAEEAVKFGACRWARMKEDDLAYYLDDLTLKEEVVIAASTPWAGSIHLEPTLHSQSTDLIDW